MKPMVRAFIEDESGLALFTVLGIISLLTVLVLAGYTLASNTLAMSTKTSDQTQAFQAANSAIDMALARIQDNGYVAQDYPVTGTDSIGATYSAEVTPTANSEFVCTARGTYHGSRENIKVKFFYLNLWNMILASGTGNALGGGSTKGTTSVYGPFYARGSVELGSNARVERGPLFIKSGGLTLTGSGEIGELGAIDLYVTGAYPENGSKGMHARTISQSVPDIKLPVVDAAYLQAKYDLAKSESFDNVAGYTDSGVQGWEATGFDANTYTTLNPPSNGVSSWYGNSSINYRRKATGASTYYKVVGSDSQIASPTAGTHALTIGGTGSFGSWAGDGHYPGTQSDDFAYDDVNNILYVSGTVFVDGPLVLNESMTYVGNGTIVANGDITMNGNFNAYPLNSGVNATHCVGLVTPGSIICNAGNNNQKNPDGPYDVEGAFFAYKDWSMSNNVAVKGSVLAASITFSHANQHLVTNPLLSNYLPKSMPGSGQCILTRGAWVR